MTTLQARRESLRGASNVNKCKIGRRVREGLVEIGIAMFGCDPLYL